MIYFRLTINNLEYKKFVFLIIGFFLVQSILGYNNYKRSGQFYILTATSKINLHSEIVARVMTNKFNLSGHGFHSMEGVAAQKWLKKNEIKLKKGWIESIKTPGYRDYRDAINENDRTKFDKFIRNRTIGYFLEYPLDFMKHAIKNSLHIGLLNPFHVYTDNNFVSGEKYYMSKIHAQLIPYRLIYSLIIYTICTYGLYSMVKKKEYNILFYLTLSILYFYAFVSWHGNTRYFMPVMIYLAFFFGYGLDKILTLKKIRNLK